MDSILETISDWQAFWLLVEWGIFVTIMVVGIAAWIVLKVMGK